MPFVFKLSGLLLISALVAGQSWQHGQVPPGTAEAAAAVRAECPAMGGPKVVKTKGDQVRFYDAYGRRIVGGLTGFSGGCARP